MPGTECFICTLWPVASQMERWSHYYPWPIAEAAAAQQVELCAQVMELIRGSQVLSPVLSGSREDCSVAISFYQGSPSLKRAGHVGVSFCILSPSHHMLCV